MSYDKILEGIPLPEIVRFLEKRGMPLQERKAYSMEILESIVESFEYGYLKHHSEDFLNEIKSMDTFPQEKRNLVFKEPYQRFIMGFVKSQSGSYIEALESCLKATNQKLSVLEKSYNHLTSILQKTAPFETVEVRPPNVGKTEFRNNWRDYGVNLETEEQKKLKENLNKLIEEDSKKEFIHNLTRPRTSSQPKINFKKSKRGRKR